jgi:hypothetical protein
MQEKIAKITGTFLGWQDHGILTAQLDLDYGSGGGSQWTPGHFCDRSTGHDADYMYGREGTAYGMTFVARLIKACGAKRWEDIKGRTVIAIIENHVVVGIKPLPTERGEPFMFAELAAQFGADA